MTECREFQARVTRQVAAACVTKPEAESEMFGGDVPERERTTLGSLRAHGKNARVAVNRASSSASHRSNYHCEILCTTDHATYCIGYCVDGLPVKYRIQYKVAVTVYKILTTQEPSYLTDVIRFHVPSRHLLSCSRNF